MFTRGITGLLVVYIHSREVMHLHNQDMNGAYRGCPALRQPSPGPGAVAGGLTEAPALGQCHGHRQALHCGDTLGDPSLWLKQRLRSLSHKTTWASSLYPAASRSLQELLPLPDHSALFHLSPACAVIFSLRNVITQHTISCHTQLYGLEMQPDSQLGAIYIFFSSFCVCTPGKLAVRSAAG